MIDYGPEEVAVVPKRPMAEPPPEEFSLDQVNSRYLGQWILLRITAFDEDHIPARGFVLAHGREKRVGEVLATLAADPPRWEPPYYFFCAYPRVRSGQALRAAIEAAKQGDRGARRLW